MKQLARTTIMTMATGLLLMTPIVAQQEPRPEHDEKMQTQHEKMKEQEKQKDAQLRSQQQPGDLEAARDTDRIQETGLRPDSKGGILVAPTMIGKVLEVEEHAILLDTVIGKQYVVRVPQTDVQAALEPGALVAVDFHRTSHGVQVAAQIREPRGEDEQAMARLEADYQQAMREDYQLTTSSEDDGSYKAKARGGPNLGHTLIGTVVSMNDEQIVVETTTGRETLVITPQTEWTLQPQVGDRVAVDFNRTSQKVPVATQIRAPEPTQ